jgi:hypothetical protein
VSDVWGCWSSETTNNHFEDFMVGSSFELPIAVRLERRISHDPDLLATSQCGDDPLFLLLASCRCFG